MHTRTFKKAISLLFTTALFAAAARLGWLEMVWEADVSYLSSLILLLFVWAQVSIFRDKWDDVDFCAEQMPNFGLIGTVVGFILALLTLDPSAATTADGAKEMVTTLVSGMGVALYTTLVGSLGYIWVALQSHIFNRG